MKNSLRIYVKVLLVGTLLAAFLAFIALVLLRVEQCPAHYTQAQVDATGCSVGANIGQGIMLLAAVAVEAVTIISAIVLAVVKRNRHTGKI